METPGIMERVGLRSSPLTSQYENDAEARDAVKSLPPEQAAQVLRIARKAVALDPSDSLGGAAQFIAGGATGSKNPQEFLDNYERGLETTQSLSTAANTPLAHTGVGAIDSLTSPASIAMALPLGSSFAEAPLKTAAGYAAGVGASKALEAGTSAVGATPAEKEAASELGMFLPSVAARAAGVRTQSVDTDEASGQGFAAFPEKDAEGNKVPGSERVKAGVYSTPEDFRAAVKVGDKQFEFRVAKPKGKVQTPSPELPASLAAGAAAGQATAAHPDMAPAMEQATNEPQPVGAEDPDSKRTIVQPTNNPAVNQAMATAAMPKFTADLEDAIKAIPGASVTAAREEKNPKRLAEKINGEGKPAETIGDYGATQISVKSPEDKDAAVAAIKAKFPVVSEDDNFEKGDKDFGYRSHSMQVQTPTGGTVEVQIVPKEVFEANPEEHGNYKTAREARITGNDTEFARQAQEAKAKNDAAMEKFNARNEVETSGMAEALRNLAATKGRLGDKAFDHAIEQVAVALEKANQDTSDIPGEALLPDGALVHIQGVMEHPEANARPDGPWNKAFGKKVVESNSSNEGGRGESPEQAAAVTSHSSTSNDVAKGEVAASADTKQSGTEIPHNESRLAKIEKGSNVVLPDGTTGTVKWTMGGKARVTTADGKQLPNVAVKDLKPAPTSTETPGPKWIGVDLDGTLARYEGYKGPTNIGEPIPAMVDRVKQWLADGQAVKIFTARAKDPEAITAIEQWSEQHLGKKLPVTNVKDDKMTQLWDDRAVQVGRNSGEALGDPEQAAAEIGKGPQKENETQVSQERSGVPQPEGTAGGKEPAAEPVAAAATEPARSSEGTGPELGSSKPASPVEEKRKAFVAKKPTAKELASTLQGQGKDVKVASDMDGAMFSLTGPTWYLKSEKLIDQKMRGPMTGDQVLRMLENGGVKADELKWTGLPEFLKGKFRVTPEQVKQQLADGGLKIKEVMKPEAVPVEWKTYPGGIMYTPDGYTIERLSGNGRYRLDTPAGMAETFATPEEAKAQVDKYRSNTRADTEPTKYSFYQLPGGDNYRELLLTMPTPEIPEPTAGFVAKQVGTESPHGYEIGKWEVKTPWGTTESVRAANEEEAINRAKTKRPSAPDNSFRSAHWDEPNILAHIRFNDRTTPDGKRLLHIEELQSDWHQRGRDKGYEKEQVTYREVPVSSLPKSEQQVFDKYKTVHEAIGQDGRRLYVASTRAEAEKGAEPNRGKGVPDAPFKKDWHEMAFRRAVRYAAENGYDGVCWTPGEKQAERYDLSKQVDKIAVPMVNEGDRSVRIDPTGGTPFKMMVKNDGTVEGFHSASQFTGKKLDEVIGKEMAKKIMEVTEPTTFAGEGLKVGGEGMKGFYDKIMPDYARKFGKQWGAKVGEAKIKAGPEPDGLRIRENDAGDYEVMSGDKSLAKTSSYNEAEKMIDDLMTSGQMVPVPVLDITPEMRKSVVQQGVPMFNRDPVGQALDRGRFYAIPADGGNAPMVQVDSKAQEAINDIEPALAKGGLWAGATVPKSYADELVQKLNLKADDLDRTGGSGARMRSLASTIDSSRDAAGNVVLLGGGGTRVQGEEQFHAFQFRQGSLADVAMEVGQHPAVDKALQHLERQGYTGVQRAIHEATAKTFNGDWQGAGLTREEGASLLNEYLDAIVKMKGKEALSDLPRLKDEIADVVQEAYERHQVPQQDRSGTAAEPRGSASEVANQGERGAGSGRLRFGDDAGGSDNEDSGSAQGTLFSRSPDATGDRDESEPLRDLVDRIKAQKAEKRNLLDRFKKESQRSIDSLKGGASAVARGLASIKGISAAAWDSYRRPPAWTDFKDATGKFQAAEQFADHAMNEFADEIKRVVPDKAKREAMTNWVEADGSDATLKSRANSLRDLAKNVARWKDKQSIPAPWMETVSKVVMNAEATGKSLADVAKKLDSMAKGYDLARELSPDEKKLSGHIREYLDTQLDNAIKSGLISHSFWQNYITHIYEGDTRGIQALINFGELAPNPAFIKKRVFATYFEGEMFGMMPRDKDIGYLTAAYHDAFTKALASRAYIGSLLEGKASDGRPLAILGSRGRWVQLNPDQMVSIQEQRKRPDSLGDYRTVDHPALRNWNWELTDKDAEEVSPKLFDDPEKALAIQGDLMLHPEIAGKVANILGKSAIAANAVGKAALKVSTTLKQSLLSFSGFHQTQEGLHAMEHKILPAKMPDLDFDNPTQRALVEHGLVVANFDGQSAFSEGVSGTELTQHIPLIGNLLHSYQDYLFRSYIPRLKMAMATHALQRNRMRYRGKLNDDQILEMTANQANAAFGGLNYKMMGRNKTFQDLLRLVLLAPDFLEARARFAAQATKPFGQEQRSALLRGALIFYAIARILNAILNDGDMKLEPSMAFSVNYKGHRVGLRTVQGDILRLATDPRSFAFNRLNPMTTRPAVEFITGRDQFGRQKDITSQGKDYLKSAVPIPAQGYLNNMDTTWPESIANALGLETGKYRSPAEEEAFRQHLQNIPDKPEDEDKIAESRQNKKLEDKLRDGRMTSAELWDMVGPGKPLTPKQAGDITKRSANQPIVNYAKNLSIEQMIPVFEKANVAERDLLRPELYKKSAELANRPEKERAKLQSQLDRLMEEDQKYQAKR